MPTEPAAAHRATLPQVLLPTAPDNAAAEAAPGDKARDDPPRQPDASPAAPAGSGAAR